MVYLVLTHQGQRCVNIKSLKPGPSEAGRLGRPEPPHFSRHYSKSSQSTLGCHASLVACDELRRAHCRESVHVVNIIHVLPSAAGLCEFSSTFVFLSDRDRDLFVSTVSTWPQLTELEIDGCK